MYFSAPPSRWHVQRRITLLGILGIHVALLWIVSSGGKQRQINTVQYLSLIHVRPMKKSNDKVDPPLPSQRNIGRKANIAKLIITEAIGNAPKIEMPTIVPTTPNTDTSTSLNINSLRSQAVRMELSRVKSDIEKMNDGKKLNLSVEAKLDRELNKIVLPECGAALMGKLMPERMMITQDHSKKKFCQ